MDNEKIIRLTKEEKEVNLTYNEADGFWHAYVTSEYWIKEFDNSGWECIKTSRYKDGIVLSKEYIIPKNGIKIAKKINIAKKIQR